MKIKVFIENEAGSNQKNIYDEKTLRHKKTVTVSREYPYPYGFILNTTGEDGDNVDCFVLTKRKLKTGEIVECKPIAIMEQIESSWTKSEVEEEDHNILAVLEDEDFKINDAIKNKLSEFISHVFDHLPDKKVKVGHFLDEKEATDHIEQSGGFGRATAHHQCWTVYY